MIPDWILTLFANFIAVLGVVAFIGVVAIGLLIWRRLL